MRRYTRPIFYLVTVLILTNLFLLLKTNLSQNVILGKALVFRKNSFFDSHELLTHSKNVNHDDLMKYSFQDHADNIKRLKENISYEPRSAEHHVEHSRIVKKETITYSEFRITEPNFINDFGKELFYKNSENLEKIGVPSKEQLIGEIVTVRKGTYVMPYDCGYRSNVSFVVQNREIPPGHWFRALALMIVPEGGTFQHFLDGTLPKIIQALDYLTLPQVKILMPRIRDKIVYEILEKLNINRDKIIIYSGSVGADYLVYTCVTPPIHPSLWQRAQSLLGVPEKLRIPKTRSNIVILTRKGCFNCGRMLLNQGALLSRLENKYASANIKVFEGPLNLNDSIVLFGSASVVLGVHGGGLYNINFCPRNTTVIEIMPTRADGTVTRAGAQKIFWLQSVLLGHQYWRLPVEPVNQKGDVNVNITHVENIIDKTLGV